MKAIVQERYGPADVLQLREIDRPPIEDGRVLVRVRAASVNALDWRVRSGAPWIIRMFEGLLRPKVPVRGADVAGVVEAVGNNVTRFKPGDEVFGGGRGTFAEFASSRETSLALKPRSLTFEQAAAIPVAGCTALQGLRDNARLQPGQRVLVNGAGGGVGTFAVQIAKALGAHVTAVTSTGNVDLVRSIGADEVIDYTREDFVGRGHRYDVLFDLGGNRSFAECRRILNPNGALVLAGAHSAWRALGRWAKARVMSRFVSQRLMGFVAKTSQEDLVRLAELVDAGTVTPVIDRRYPLSEAAEAVRYVEEGHARGKVVITVA